ncbi:MAG TPA: LacI family DNA-binding transcriptional regulator [Solirubrobacter sp.]|nr:LacI family DNA-binding transcriptional regulator [Solirubrobacter sp.]
MADVARLAGVSVTTVSHVINGTRPASERTRERVLEAIERTGYRPNTLARALARGGTQSLGLAISGLSNPYFSEVVSAIEGAASRAGHTLLLGDTREDPEQELRIVRALAERQVDGMLLAPTAGALEHALPYLESQGIPTVLLDRFVDADFDQVGSDNEQPTARLVEHLIDRGHRRIGMAIGIRGLSTTDERVRGYKLALERGGLGFDPALLAEGASERDRARAAMDALLDLDDPPTAMVSGNNFMTIGVLRAFADRGLRVPDDMALVAFDDFEWADLFAPRLTVIRQPTAELGERAVALLLSRLEDPERPPRRERLEATFVHRDSCGCTGRSPAPQIRAQPSEHDDVTA